MSLNEALAQKNITKYRLWKESGVPQATISDICTGKTRIEKSVKKWKIKINIGARFKAKSPHSPLA